MEIPKERQKDALDAMQKLDPIAAALREHRIQTGKARLIEAGAHNEGLAA